MAKFLIGVFIIASSILFIMITSTTPASAGAFGILAVFLLAYLALVPVVTFLLWMLSKSVVYMTGLFVPHPGKGVVTMGVRRAYYYATVIALGPVMVISLQSVGSLGGYEIGLIGLFVLIGCLYVTKRTDQV